jgi:hypothetical protein
LLDGGGPDAVAVLKLAFGAFMVMCKGPSGDG